MTPRLHPQLTLACPRCGDDADPHDLALYRGCPRCAGDGVVVNVVATVPPDQVTEAIHAALAAPSRHAGVWRWAGALPVLAGHEFSLGEGGTPLLDLPSLAERAGVRRVSVKNETTNPTWSHKDRLASVTVAAARAVGATTVTGASTGNHGAALAAYAARTGTRCVIYTVGSVPETMKILMQSYAAEVVVADSFSHRYELMAASVDAEGWFPGSNGTAPPVGSHPLGVAGYRTLAYEIFEQCRDDMPDRIVVPLAYGDCAAGIQQGMADLVAAGLIDRAPAIIAAEVFGALTSYLDGGGVGPVEDWPPAAFSISAVYATQQAAHAVTSTGGWSVRVTEREVLDAQAECARTTGLFVEASTAAAVAALDHLGEGEGTGTSDGHVLLVATSSGLKDPHAIRPLLPELDGVTA